MIFYFSATGNSLHAARRLRGALGESLVDIPRALRARELTYALKEGERVGFVFPVYFFGLPTVVEEFVRGLTLEGSPRPYVYAVLSCGSFPGMADRRLARLLEGRGHSLDASFPLPMVDNYILLYDVRPPERQRIQLAAADRELDRIIGDVAAERAGERSSGPLAWAATTLLHPLYVLGRRTRRFHALDRCTGCGLCEEICPSGAIRLNGSGPEWTMQRCAHCLGCIHRCPQEAIQYGRATAKRRRYTHPALRQGRDGRVDAADVHAIG